MTEDGITRFLPKYPNISAKNDSNLLNPYNGDFYNTIYNKKEFRELKLEKTEAVPTQPGNLMKHQEIIARYMSSHTPYDGLLLFHEMGTGKTCSAVGAIEQVRKDGKFKGAIYVASKVLSDKFLHEILYTCTDGRYIPEDLGKTEETKERRLRKAVSDYYKLGKDYTYQTFAKKLSNMSTEVIRNIYSNHIIVIDEVHNITDMSGKKKDTNPEVYKNIHKLLHNTHGCKVLLLSGTPMRNTVNEISSVMNLILPKDEQLPVTEFLNEFFKDGILTKSGTERLQVAFKGRVSYLRAITSDVRRVFKGKSLEGNKEYFKVVESRMSKFQSEVYKDVEEKEKNDGVHLALRQVSLMVFPDKSYGSEGFKKYVKVNTSLRTFGGKTKMSLLQSFKTILKQPETMEKKIELLSKFSTKYADSIRIINESISQNKLVFIYNEFVTGSGIIIFSLILEAFGFIRVTRSKPQARDNTPTFAVLTGNTSNITGLISTFNNENNIDGSYINVIIGSQTISEGVSFKNIQVEIIQTPWFNYARTDQAIARGYRVGSHRALQKKYPNKDLTLDIYQQVAIPEGNIQWSEIDMYMLSQQKDIRIKKIELLLRESAFDCQLTYDRNHIIAKDGSRECDYGNCEYKCKGITTKNNEVLDYSTYNLYYINKEVARIIIDITKLFQINFILSLEEIRLELERDESNDFELITSLESIINNSVQITNKYGFTSYLQESGNSYFLVDSLSTIGKSTLSYYTKYPCVKEQTSYEEIVRELYINEWLPKVLRSMCEDKGKNMKQYINRLPLEIQEILLESSIIGIIKSKTLSPSQRIMNERIVEYFESNIKEINKDIIMSSLLELNGGPMKCLDISTKKLSWKECTPEQTTMYKQAKVDIRLEMEEGGEYYGLIDDKSKNFCIRDLRGGVDKKGHQLTSGQICSSYNHWDLNYIIAFHTDLSVPPSVEIINILKSGDCGYMDGSGNVKLPKTTTVSWSGLMKGVIKKENKVRPSGTEISQELLDVNNKEFLGNFLVTSAIRSRDNIQGKPSYDDRNFGFGKSIFMHILSVPSKSSKTKQWNDVIKRIKELEIDVMRRLIFFGSMKKADKCLFLCAWFKKQKRMISDPFCGRTNKPKPGKK